MKNKSLILFSILIIVLSLTACVNSNKTPAYTNSGVVAEYSFRESTVADDLQNKSPKAQHDTKNDTDNKIAFTTTASQSDFESTSKKVEAPPIPSTSSSSEETSATESVSTDSDGWINKWY